MGDLRDIFSRSAREMADQHERGRTTSVARRWQRAVLPVFRWTCDGGASQHGSELQHRRRTRRAVPGESATAGIVFGYFCVRRDAGWPEILDQHRCEASRHSTDDRGAELDGGAEDEVSFAAGTKLETRTS